MTLNVASIGALRLALILLSLISLPLVVFADMPPQGIGVLTAYVVPALVVIFFFVLLLDALMNRVFMIDQAPASRGERRVRMWLDLATAASLLLVWGTYFRSLLNA
ncbi:MAG: hypothetical protein H6959_01340 [Chromatiaceae bacterium]|nr:hypothetical protein [Gammaproteobacteria bacterium]MCP5300989.1 hypothetical protein [Chromatiaceae bacterium]MCP5421538.1 hypothetical protein [Chromatiaceae bacterium]